MRKRFIITTITVVSMGIVLFIGDQLSSSDTPKKSEELAVEEVQVVKRSRGKYAEENSEKTRFFNTRNLHAI